METAKEILDKVRTIKSNDVDKDVLIYKNRATVAGAVVGGMAGLYYGYSKKTNMLVTTLMGVLGGGILVRLFLPKD